MTELTEFLDERLQIGASSTEDVLSSFLPLAREVLEARADAFKASVKNPEKSQFSRRDMLANVFKLDITHLRIPRVSAIKTTSAYLLALKASARASGYVAPLQGLDDLHVDGVRIWCAESKRQAPQSNEHVVRRNIAAAFQQYRAGVWPSLGIAN